MKFDIITIFPEFFTGPFEHGIIRRAKEAGLVKVGIHDLRSHTRDRHKTVDDRPFGGGEGMVLKPEPLFESIEELGFAPKGERNTEKESVVLLSAQGRMFNQRMASQLAGLERIAFICGRYEGVDERVSEHLADREVSVGDFVLSGGELGAALMIDAITRLLPGALGNEASNRQESFTTGLTSASRSDVEQITSAAGTAVERINTPSSTCGSGGMLDYPHYTRPAQFRGFGVPEILAGGDHSLIRKWRRKQALRKTLTNRPDLLEQARSAGELTVEDDMFLDELKRESK